MWCRKIPGRRAAKSKELYLGKYEIKEITAPSGMALNDENHPVELVYAGQNVAVTETSTSFYNEMLMCGKVTYKNLIDR